MEVLNCHRTTPVLAKLLVCLLAVVRGEDVNPIVATPYGQLRGSRIPLGQHEYVDTFFNIPYAKPPIGDLRFKPSQPPTAWTGVRDATTFGPQCPQPSWPFGPPLKNTFPNSEDCLQLSVYTPKVQGNQGLPVMVWAHGGWWVGTGNTFNGTLLAARGVVVVTINFRLSTFGFLSTEDAASPGNYGLWDMIRALEWVRDSISAFNGDPNDVTIFGESAGGVLTSLLLDARPAKGLFHKAIMQSGCSLSSYGFGHPLLDPKPKEQARKLAQIVGCDASDSTRMMACLRTKDFMAIVSATEQIRSELGLFAVPFRPVAETTFGQSGMFSAVPLAMLEDGDFANVSTIRGFTSAENGGSVASMDEENDGFTMEEIINATRDLVQEFAQSTVNVNLQAIAQQALETYVYQPGITDPFDLRATYLKMLDDWDVIAPTVHELQLVTKFPVMPQYLYRFSYRSPYLSTPAWAGASHAEDVTYVFGAPVENRTVETLDFVSGWSDEDRRMSEDVMTLWTNFAKYGDPTPNGLHGVRWLPWTQATPTFLDIDLPLAARDSREMTSKINFWTETVPKILGEDNPANLIG